MSQCLIPANLTERLKSCHQSVSGQLLNERTADGHWVGELSTSALSTATAVNAIEQMRRRGVRTPTGLSLRSLVDNGLQWLAENRNADGGWGDTTKSISNISTTMLCHAAFHAANRTERFASVVDDAQNWIDAAGGVAAVLERYGKDRTFSIPILTHCAIAGLVDWKDVVPLPFELSCVPARFYKTVRLPVVSYALPALIAIGQARFHQKPPWNPLVRGIRQLAKSRSLRVLESIQPPNGGFLEATPLTSFVTMSLATIGLHEHTVARHGLRFIAESVREDGSWPIDTNLATWVSTLSVNAIGDSLPPEAKSELLRFLLSQQYREVHPYTNADPGGWAWTHLPGGVPDADDTPGAMLAVMNLCDEFDAEVTESLHSATKWLLGLQNRDGGWPTFCRGWGTLPFDRSSADLTAHTIRALRRWQMSAAEASRDSRIESAISSGFRYLKKTQREDGSWLPLWFGNQFHSNDENPTYGTARVLLAYRDLEKTETEAARSGFQSLVRHQNDDGGWGGAKGTPSTVEETSLAVEALLAWQPDSDVVANGLEWLLDAADRAAYRDPQPIGFYFAKLWYFEKLYPLSFLVSCLGRALEVDRGRNANTDQ